MAKRYIFGRSKAYVFESQQTQALRLAKAFNRLLRACVNDQGNIRTPKMKEVDIAANELSEFVMKNIHDDYKLN